MYISGLENFSDANGDGFRTVLYVSGCSHHCKGCQNPETWNPQNGVEYDEKIENKILDMLSNKHISGLTLTGGDPLYESNLDSVLELLKRIRIQFGNTKTVWLYSGYKFEDCIPTQKEDIVNVFRVLRNEIVRLCDVMVDGQFEEDKKDLTLQFRGSSNQRLINVTKTLKEGEIVYVH